MKWTDFVKLYISREKELQLSQQKEAVEELSRAKKRIEQANKDFGGKGVATSQELTELREVNGRLQIVLSNKLNCVNFNCLLNIIKLRDCKFS